MQAVYLRPTGDTAIVDDERLDGTTERHKMTLAVPAGTPGGGAAAMLERTPQAGLVIEMSAGWAGREVLALIGQTLGRGRRAWLYWPAEEAIECVDRERLSSLWRHWLFIQGYRVRMKVLRVITRSRLLVVGKVRAGIDLWKITPARELPRAIVRRLLGRSEPPPSVDGRAQSLLERIDALDKLVEGASPVPFPRLGFAPDGSRRVPGCGVYLRTDFWSRIESGGSYGHTCYVARELAAVTEQFVAFMAHRYSLLDDYGVRQVVIDPPSNTASEDDLLLGTSYYVRSLKAALQLLKPAYIYERLCLGNYTGALLSQELGIPYIVEYNGSEISMRRSFDGVGYLYEEEYLRAEMYAFRQATMISVVSEEIRSSLIARGVDATKILMNPNGADLAAYAPAPADEKARMREEAGLPPDGPVIGFTGTFGGWHGVDVLAAAIPRICAALPEARFLLIGDGNYKHLVDKAVAEHQLESRVRCVGRVPQAEGARLLKACDIYVSPHNSHMVDSRFFGSPTKIFEYMAMGGAIVASDLEQIGQILSPALTVADLRDPHVTVGAERSVLCTPGDVDEFVEAVIGTARHRELWAPLGRNSRRAVEDHYSWTKHVSHLWTFLAGGTQAFVGARRAAAPAGVAPAEPLRSPQIETGDAYKDEVQKQWDNDPAGSHYVKDAERHTLEWFAEAEAYRHGVYAPWMHETMEFGRHKGEKVLEIGGGMGTDLVQFAKHGALVTDLDLSSGHLELAKENFSLRGLPGEFVLHDAETLPFEDDTFDIVYSNGVIHHTPNTRNVVREIRRVLKPGGRAIVMVYAENSLHYWRNLVLTIGLKEHALDTQSMGEIMSRAVERSDNAAARPLVKVYTKPRLRALFSGFDEMEIVQRQMVVEEKPHMLSRVPLETLGALMGWNLIIKARKPLTK